ncbi:DUF4270 family protein [uncultured Sanguibacteroides sp.]|uniref:DUF4270 family protein n=1 Tax=uncultured Sanguibacteroides sp. TaxID=1635151 RepID=UPI0025E9B7A3|nr:DUF4270 family protein [uncultured Sanguibacteroides sp.]
MRIFFLIGFFFIALYACDNDLNTIGENLIPSTGYVEVRKYNIDKTSTIRLDSFPTSSLPYMIMGSIKDDFTGRTTATPYFHLIKTGYEKNLDFEREYVYDSLTLHFKYNQIIAGDTTQHQTYYLYRLTEFPDFDYLNPFFYNTDSLPRANTPISTLKVYPQKEYLSRAYFKVDDELGKKLFDLMRARDTVFNNGLDFLRYFKGLSIVSDKENSNLISIDGTSTNLYLRCYYHFGETKYWFDIPAIGSSGSFYNFTNYKNDPPQELAHVTQTDSLQYVKGGLGVVQGLNGYMLKLNLPFIKNIDSYRTISRAEIELKPYFNVYSKVPDAKQLGVFVSDRENGLKGVLLNGSGKPVYGYLFQNSTNVNDRKYTIDITDYYNSLVSGVPPIDQNIHLLLGLPGTLRSQDNINLMEGNISSSFNRVVLEEVPVLRIYYTQYK